MQNFLITLREKSNLSMKQLAKKVDISESYYSLLESGKRRPSVDVAKAIANVLGFDWEKFYDDGGESAS